MPLDGLFLHHLTNELQVCVGCRADKIHQPSKNELVFLLRSANFSGKLLISVRSGAARLHITSAAFDNPADPPAFCKFLRKYLSSAKIMSIEQLDLDRTVFIRFMSYNEMGDTIYPYLAIELITGRGNVILCEENGRILAALHRSDIETSTRMIQPGATYIPPEAVSKLSPFVADTDALYAAISSSQKAVGSVFQTAIDGISPLVSRELASRTVFDSDTPAASLSGEDAKKLKAVLCDFKSEIANPIPCIIDDLDGTPKDFSYIPIRQYGTENHQKESFCQLLDDFYAERETAARIHAMAHDILKLLNNAKARTERKLSLRLDELEKCKDREKLRIYGELLKANLYAIPKGAEKVTVQNYYDENLSDITIPLNKALSPSANAAEYFKEYKKTYTAEQTLTTLTEQDRKELIYIDSVLDALSRTASAAELSEIRDELADAGYIKRNPTVKRKITKIEQKEYISPSGLKILVGRNNRENDFLTTKLASKHDIWFHTKNIAGSHVILQTDGNQPDTESILFAASLAAGHSKAAKSDNVPVDFTEIRYVKKPAGAKPGMVIYTSNRTVYVKPSSGLQP